jgi:ATP-binding cassette, subfamily B, bacterial
MLKRITGESSDEEKPLHRSQTLHELSDEDRRRIESLVGDSSRVKEIIVSDILPSGVYEKNFIVRCDDRLLVIESDAIRKDIPFDEIGEVFSRDFVGNGVIEVRRKDGRKVELARYSRTLSDTVQEMAKAVNHDLGLTEEDQVERQETIDKVSGPKEAATTYRCPTCGYPLAHQGDVCPKCSRNTSFIFKMGKYLKPYLPMVTVGSLLSIVVTICNLGPGFLVKLLVDESIDNPDLTTEGKYQMLSVIIGLFLTLIVVRMVTQHFRIKIMGTLGTKLVRSLRVDAYRALQRLSLSYYDTELTGRIMSRVLGDTQMVQGFIVNALQMALINILMIIAISITLFSQNMLLSAIALGPVPIVILLGRYFSNKFKGVFRSVRRKYSSLSASVAESVSGVRVVKSFAQEEREYAEFESRNKEFHDATLSAVNTSAKFQPAVLFVMTLGTIVVWLFGGSQVIQGTLTTGTLILFITYMNQFYAPIQMLIQLTEVYQQSATAAERVFNIMNMPSELQDHDKAVSLNEPKGSIEIQNVSFAYQAGERILKNVSLQVEPGQMVGVVGQTGSGKTTLVSLICRFYDPTSGSIKIDGEDLRNIKTQSLRNNIGMVLQDTFLFARTIKENIAYGTANVTDRQIIEAAKAANAHEFIMNLPDAYDNEVGERGVTLSGGEKQRISIARAILRDPAILILDEATSAVDSATEASIQEAMDRLVKGRTTIAIAHRLSTLRNADKLIVMEKGEIVEQGTHVELLRQNGIYADLVRKQANFAQEMIVT